MGSRRRRMDWMARAADHAWRRAWVDELVAAKRITELERHPGAYVRFYRVNNSQHARGGSTIICKRSRSFTRWRWVSSSSPTRSPRLRLVTREFRRRGRPAAPHALVASLPPTVSALAEGSLSPRISRPVAKHVAYRPIIARHSPPISRVRERLQGEEVVDQTRSAGEIRQRRRAAPIWRRIRRRRGSRGAPDPRSSIRPTRCLA
jgi:hypothetical protein